MNIAGLQKVSTIDYPGEISCIIFLHGCNFRCGFCYNPDLVLREASEGFSEEYVLDFLKKRKGKLDAVCITGGEPLINLDFEFVKKIRKLGYKIKIDTNGSFPERLEELINLKLVDYIAMDIKSSKKSYARVAMVPMDISKIEKSIKLVHDFGNSEFRTTVVKRFHNEEVMKDIGKWLNKVCGEKPKQIFLQGFRKNEEGMVDNDFLNEINVSEKFLEEMKVPLENFFNEVVIR
jgi:pyruvate formate lyase activating enzyme